jgi:hypothetical protein
VLAAGGLVLAVGLAGCGGGGSPNFVRVVDLAETVGRAERRPGPSVGAEIVAEIDGDTRRALSVPPVSRITWMLTERIPARTVLRTAVAILPATAESRRGIVIFRVGMSDGRTYEDLVRQEVPVTPLPRDRRWVPIVVDLSRYGGWQWSLFYRPDERTWQVVFNTAGAGGIEDDVQGLWAEPGIDARHGS